MISVCMASYNGEKYIAEQIASILSQLGENDELIVSDDCSTDHTIDVVNSFKDSRIKIFINHGVHGYTGNFYNALLHANGDYIFLSDQDDVWCPNKVSITLEYLKEYDFVVSDAKEVDAKLSVISESRIKKYGVKGGFWPNLLRSRYIGCCMAFNYRLLKAIFPVPTYTNRYPHDLWIALIGDGYFNSHLIVEPLVLYRRHGSNASNGGEGDKGSILLLIKRIIMRFYYLFYFIKQSKHIRIVKKDY